jgi:hypothetical protein
MTTEQDFNNSDGIATYIKLEEKYVHFQLN